MVYSSPKVCIEIVMMRVFGCARSPAVVFSAADCDDVVLQFGMVAKGARHREVCDTKSCFA
jgi:hypothetical protein